MYKINEMKMPNCMAPDGADPCKAYQELYSHARAMEAKLDFLRGLLSEQDEGCLGSNGNGEIEWSLRDEVVDGITKLIDVQKSK